MVAINVALVPVHPAHDLVDSSKQLEKEVGSTYVLGLNSMAHCTLAQFEVDDPGETWTKLESLQRYRLALATTATYADKSTSGKLWFGIAIEKTSKLREFHESVLQALGLPESTFHNAVREAYKPHFTLGVDLKGTRTEVVVPWPGPRTYLCELRVGKSGQNFQFESLLF